MKIAEIFYSVQGEGVLVGTPSVFVRTSGCNLRCTWCDTPYTSWHPEGEECSIADIVEAVRRDSTGYTVITGGEPMLFADTVALTQELKRLQQHITIETAGTVWQPVLCDLMSISPKLSNSTPEGSFAGQHDRLRIQPDILRRLMAGYEHQLKFVVQQEWDIEEIDELVRQLGADPRRVVLMPEGIEPGILRERSLWLVELCKKTGYRFSPRLHVDLYGNRRGV